MNGPFTTPQIRPLAISSPPREASVGEMIAGWLRTAGKQAAKHRDLILVVAFCAIGLTVTIAAMVQMPDFSDAIAQISLVP
jgi:hypothetical protein